MIANTDDVRDDLPAPSGRSGNKGRHAHPSIHFTTDPIQQNQQQLD